ncbi:acyl-CoA dehydrogenase family protein [Bradyrhizobium sp. JYMT SZCCT0180]|uniref:acyl-CoA dehydrogenase family protein n=1 Tax=Bradyrhizobium sp. JYMT SZCCT0180 TaxID=2807666 RepID=UPI001BACE1DA|nr:acyl-CoA dehydrogenase family protein [Bradyrhizobium sp. JYMT SZCCT0180]MBR1212039.1 hypothetical protein [Bradyrhizobium sp. JYMT SZCCT0180]
MDNLIATAADLAGDRAIIARAEAVRPEVAAAGNDIENKRRLPPALLDRLHDAQLFRLLLPRSTDGIETDPVTFFHVIETIAKADASTAWCLSQAGGCAMSAAYLDLPVARAIFGDPRAVLAWGPGRVGLCLRWSARDLARRALSDPCGRRHSQAGSQRYAAGADHAGANRGRRMDRHLEYGRPARHRQRPVRAE